MADEQAVVDAMAESLSRLGRIDSCIANAGVGGGAPLTEQTTEQWRKVTAVNLDAVFWTFREAARHMVARAEQGDKGGSLLVGAPLLLQLPLPLTAGKFDLALQIPYDENLIGGHVFWQAVAPDPTLPAGFALSNGLDTGICAAFP